MPAYRLYEYKDGHIRHRPHEFESPDDSAALKHARQFIDGVDLELWQGKRLVTKLLAPPKPN